MISYIEIEVHQKIFSCTINELHLEDKEISLTSINNHEIYQINNTYTAILNEAAINYCICW